MSDFAIRAENLGKRYQIGTASARHDTLGDAVAHAVRAPLRQLERLRAAGPRDDRSDAGNFWAVRDVSFEVKRGEMLGIIGGNGAGKSTLLKILARIVEPTTGSAQILGRVGALLEVGTGFHPELTGRENVFLNGSILGMDRAYIARRFDDIVEFSGVERFIDTPVKRYSSGMYLRLAFAVAAHLEPEILVVDEVLAVGDAEFQKKCMGKMGEVAGEGRTVLFVSHNLTAVQSLCQRALWMRSGTVAETGPSGRVIHSYLSATLSNQTEQLWDDLETAPGSEGVKLRRVAVRRADGLHHEPIDVLTPLRLEFDFWNRVPGVNLNLSVVVTNEEGTPLFNTVPTFEPNWHGRAFPAGLFRSEFVIPGGLLNDGTHRVQLYVVKDQSVVLSRHDDVLVFEVADVAELRGNWFGKWVGAVRPMLDWRTEMLDPSNAAALTSV